MKSRFAYKHLSEDLQELIREHTSARFAVESDFTMRLRFPGVGWTDVPYVIRYELLLTPRDLSTGPEINVTLSRFLNPAFKHSRLFRQSDASMQKVLAENSKEISFLSVSAVRLERRHDCEFLQFVSRTSAVQHAFRTPFWARTERSTIQAVCEKLQSMFHMKLEM